MIAEKDLIKGGIYKISSRNLSIGVYDGKQGFIGIREKFESRYLFTEYYDDGTNQLGTVKPKEFISMLPDYIVISEELGTGTIDAKTRRPLEYIEGKGWFWWDTGERVKYSEASPMIHSNRRLFKYLDRIQNVKQGL